MNEKILREYTRRLSEGGYTFEYIPDENRLDVQYQNVPIFRVEGAQTAKAKDLSGIHKIKANEAGRIYVQVCEYVTAFENNMTADPSLLKRDGCKILLTYNRTTFAMRDDGEWGYTFLLLESGAVKEFFDYETAKQRFVMRSGLLSPPAQADFTCENRKYYVHFAAYPPKDSPAQNPEMYTSDVTAAGYADALCNGWENATKCINHSAKYTHLEYLGMTWETDPADFQDYLNQMVSEAVYFQNVEKVFSGMDISIYEVVPGVGAAQEKMAVRLAADLGHVMRLYPPQYFLEIACCEKALDGKEFANTKSRMFLQNAVFMAKNGCELDKLRHYYENGIGEVKNGSVAAGLCAPPKVWDLSKNMLLRDVYSGNLYRPEWGRQKERFADALKAGDTELAEKIYEELPDKRIVTEYAGLAASKGLVDITNELVNGASLLSLNHAEHILLLYAKQTDLYSFELVYEKIFDPETALENAISLCTKNGDSKSAAWLAKHSGKPEETPKSDGEDVRASSYAGSGIDTDTEE